MEIEWLAVAEGAGFHQDGRPYVIGIYTNPVEVKKVPFNFQLFAVAKIKATIQEFARPHTLTFRLVNMDGQSTGEAHVTVPPVKGVPRVNLYVIGGGQIPVPGLGRYEVQILIDGTMKEGWPTWTLDFVQPTSPPPP